MPGMTHQTILGTNLVDLCSREHLQASLRLKDKGLVQKLKGKWEECISRSRGCSKTLKDRLEDRI